MNDEAQTTEEMATNSSAPQADDLVTSLPCADLAAAAAHIEALTGDPATPVTIQTFSDKKPDPLPKGWTDPLARVLHGTLAVLAPELIRLNADGGGVFLLVNEGDLLGRKTKNVKALRAVFTDNESNAVPAHPLQPTFTVGSARGPHDYWGLEPGTSLDRFRGAQKLLAAYYSSDPVVIDLPRVMRLAGFFHQKFAPVMVTFRPGTGKKHTLDEILSKHSRPESKSVASPTEQSTTTTQRTDRGETRRLALVREKAQERDWNEGHRHESAKATAAHARKLDLTDDALRDVVLEFAIPAGLPAVEVDAIVSWTLSNVDSDPEEADACDEDNDEDDGRKPSCAAQLIEIGRSGYIFHDERGDGYVAFTSGSVRRVMKIRSSALSSELCRRYSQKFAFKKAANGEAVAAARNVLEALAVFEGAEHRLSTRFARHEGDVFIDMADAEYRAIKITERGWEIVDTPPLLFRRFPHMRPLPEPVRGGDLLELFEPFALADAEKILLTAYVVTIPLANIPRPLLQPHGPQGSGKTTLLKRILATIDPTGIDDLDLSGEPRELAQLLDQHGLAFFDNVARISDSAARLLCKAATGGGFEKRKLYTDEESVILTFKRAVMVSSINVPTHAPDLLDRCLLLPMDRIPPEKRQVEADLWKTFEAQRPAILGALLDALSAAMAIYPTLRHKEYPRMADFAAWGAAVAEGLGLTLMIKDEVEEKTFRGAAAFLRAYQENIRRQTEEVVEADPVARAVLDLVRAEGSWRGTASDLLARLKDKHEDEIKSKDSGWPKRSDGLSRRLGILASTLADEGIIVRRTREGKDRSRIISLAIKKWERASAPSAASAASAEVQPAPPPADASGTCPGDGVHLGVRPDAAAEAADGLADTKDAADSDPTACTMGSFRPEARP